MHCSTSPSQSTASPWRASAGNKAMITHGPSGRWSRKPLGSHSSINHGAAATVSRHARGGPTPPPSATASTATGSSSGATMRARRTRGPCGCASTCSRHGSSGPRKWRGGREPTRRRDQPSVCARHAVGIPGAIRLTVVPGVRVPVFKPHSIRFPQNGVKGRHLSTIVTAGLGSTSDRSTLKKYMTLPFSARVAQGSWGQRPTYHG